MVKTNPNIPARPTVPVLSKAARLSVTPVTAIKVAGDALLVIAGVFGGSGLHWQEVSIRVTVDAFVVGKLWIRLPVH